MLAFVLGTSAALRANPPEFVREIAPIFERRCVSCHGRLQQKGDLRLDAGVLVLKGGKDGVVVRPGDSQGSELIRRIRLATGEDRMPPEGMALDPAEVALVAAWVDSGAAVPRDERVPVSPAEHWAFRPVKRPAIPSVREAGWCRNPIDAFILAKLEARGWVPSPGASSPALLRRLHLDLVGLPPTPPEQEAFEKRAGDEALDAVVEDLLKRPGYGERWGRHWLDTVRYADSNGYERDAPKPLVWRYRDYVIRSLNADKPFDRFLVEQLAGDELPDATADTLLATGYYRLGHWDDEPADPEADRYDQLDDLIATLSEGVMGLTLACARCHDHKFEPLTMRDYYGMLSVFHPLRRPQNGRTELTMPVGSPAELEILAVREREVARLEREVRSMRETFRERFLASGRTSLSADVLAAFQTPADRRTEAQKSSVLAATGALEMELAGAMPEALREGIAARERLASEWRARVPELPQGYFLTESSASVPETRILLRGNPGRPGDRVGPSVPEIVGGVRAEFSTGDGRTTRRRLGLARWLTSPSNPLTARVMVNRVWQQHFGVGLVRTPGDFGLMGEVPTHPELLDWLAHWFMNDARWSLKELHRLILASRSWRMSRGVAGPAAEADPEQRWLASLPRRRLEVEAIRDSMLAVSGALNPEMYGPPMYPQVPVQAIEANTDKESIWRASAEKDRSRRSIYAFVKRGLVVPMFEVLDFADTVHCTARRTSTTVATQALTLFNGDFVNEQAGRMAERLRREAGGDPDRQVGLAYRLALCREPREGERRRALEFLRRPGSPIEGGVGLGVKDDPLRELCRVMLNLNEFAYTD